MKRKQQRFIVTVRHFGKQLSNRIIETDSEFTAKQLVEASFDLPNNSRVECVTSLPTNHETPTPEQILEARAIRADYRTNERGAITNPGKFEGEQIFAPFFWDIALQGFSDSDNGVTYTFRFTKGCADFVLWPELKKWLGRSRSIHLSESEQGFVYCR